LDPSQGFRARDMNGVADPRRWQARQGNDSAVVGWPISGHYDAHMKVEGLFAGAKVEAKP
jgi:hypothetical protein